MKKIIGLVIFAAPLSALACGSSEGETAVINALMWVLGIAFYASLLTTIGYSILLFFIREKRIKRIIFGSTIVLLISLLLMLFIVYVYSRLLCSTSQF